MFNQLLLLFLNYARYKRGAAYDHSIEREGIEHPTSGTSFLEVVAILYVITIAAATADADFKQFLDGMEVVDEGSAGEFRSLAEF